MLVHCHGRITVETEGLQAETGSMLWLVKGADGNTLQEEEGGILRVIMQQACQMSSLVLECSALSILEKMAIHTGEKRVPTSTLALINGPPMQTQVVCPSYAVLGFPCSGGMERWMDDSRTVVG